MRKFDFLFKKHSFLVDLFCSGGIIAIRESITTLRKKPIHNRQSARTVLRPETKNVRNHSIFLGDNKWNPMIKRDWLREEAQCPPGHRDLCLHFLCSRAAHTTNWWKYFLKHQLTGWGPVTHICFKIDVVWCVHREVLILFRIFHLYKHKRDVLEKYFQTFPYKLTIKWDRMTEKCPSPTILSALWH